MPDYTAHFFLVFSQLTCFLMIVFLGFLLINRVIFFQVTVLGAFSILVNVVLKGLFKVPLAASLHKIGYAFPSGHMQMSCVFYGWLMLCIRNWYVRLLGTLLLFGIGAGLIHFGYHDLQDVIAGVLVGAGMIGLFKQGLYHCEQLLYFLFPIIGSFLMLVIWAIYSNVPSHAFWAYGVLLSVVMLERWFLSRKTGDKYWCFLGLNTLRN